MCSASCLKKMIYTQLYNINICKYKTIYIYIYMYISSTTRTNIHTIFTTSTSDLVSRDPWLSCDCSGWTWWGGYRRGRRWVLSSWWGGRLGESSRSAGWAPPRRSWGAPWQTPSPHTSWNPRRRGCRRTWRSSPRAWPWISQAGTLLCWETRQPRHVCRRCCRWHSSLLESGIPGGARTIHHLTSSQDKRLWCLLMDTLMCW